LFPENRLDEKELLMQIRSRNALLALVWLIAAPALVYGQASITGVVRDTSGAVLPGATVEAASPALIEKVRSVVSDGAGQYRIVDLRPGTYTVTFTLPGFTVVRREGIELAGTFTATINAELRVGGLEETLTVTGETPIVDVQSAQQQQIVSREVISALPTSRSYQQLVTLNPSVVVSGQDVGGSRGPESDRYTARGTLYSDSRIMVDGLGVASADGGGASGTFYVPNMSASQEVVATTSGGLGEAETAGVIVNVIPRDGGNTLSGTGFATGARPGMQGDNSTQALRDQGLQARNRLARMWDLNGAAGGPVLHDKLWYFLSGRYAVADNFVAGMFHNKNANDPTAWTYEPDLSRQAIQDTTWWSAALRMTWQAGPRHKFEVFWDEQYRCAGCPGATPTASPETRNMGHAWPRVWQGTWTSPRTNRLLLEAGVGEHYLRWGGWAETPEQFLNEERIRVTEQAGRIPGLSYAGAELPNIPVVNPINADHHTNHTYNWRSSLSYVTGTHNAKVGYRGSFYGYRKVEVPHLGLTYRFNNGVPNQITERFGTVVQAHLQSHGVYAQDQWTIRRLTLQGAVRYDHWRSAFPARQLGPHFYIPAPFLIPATTGSNFHDISPRVAAAYDLWGNGKTGLKIHLGKYMVGQESSDTGVFGSHMDPARRIASSTSRSWNDLNRDYFPDCNLRDPAANGECGAMSNGNFGTDVPASIGGRDFSVNYDPDVTHGWGVRPYSWEFAASIQHELLPRVSAMAGYTRRWFGNFTMRDNIATTAADYTRFDLPVPVDPRLPNSGGVVTGVATVNPDKFGQVRDQVTAVSKFGKRIDRSQAVDLSVNARLEGGLVLQGGLNLGSRLWDNCELARQFPEMAGLSALEENRASGAPPLQFCRQKQPLQTQVKGFAAYTVPRLDVQVSGTWQSLPGPEILANWDVPNSVVAPIIGRNLAGGARNETVLLLSPLSTYGDRLNQLNFRVAKLLRIRGTRALVGMDLFNALNSSVVLRYNNTFGPQWLTPTSIIDARLLKVSAQIDF
jgi:hypothetical protein